MKFVDTAEKVREREDKRKNIQRILEWEVKQEQAEQKARAKNKNVGQLSLGETTLLNFRKGTVKKKW
jgi:hypothetical protein